MLLKKAHFLDKHPLQFILQIYNAGPLGFFEGACGQVT